MIFFRCSPQHMTEFLADQEQFDNQQEGDRRESQGKVSSNTNQRGGSGKAITEPVGAPVEAQRLRGRSLITGMTRHWRCCSGRTSGRRRANSHPPRPRRNRAGATTSRWVTPRRVRRSRTRKRCDHRLRLLQRASPETMP